MKEDLFWLTGTEVSVCLGKEGMAPQEPISKQPEKTAVREGGKTRIEVGGKDEERRESMTVNFPTSSRHWTIATSI